MTDIARRAILAEGQAQALDGAWGLALFGHRGLIPRSPGVGYNPVSYTHLQLRVGYDLELRADDALDLHPRHLKLLADADDVGVGQGVEGRCV